MEFADVAISSFRGKGVCSNMPLELKELEEKSSDTKPGLSVFLLSFSFFLFFYYFLYFF